MINIIIPMAGKGSRFANAGYELPKPLIDVNNKPMIELVIENLKPEIDHKFIFICQKEHLEKFTLREILIKKVENCEIIELENEYCFQNRKFRME
jgi:NDP-sugar pyrophosphorylase family protein